jgi:hypothetical protein
MKKKKRFLFTAFVFFLLLQSGFCQEDKRPGVAGFRGMAQRQHVEAVRDTMKLRQWTARCIEEMQQEMLASGFGHYQLIEAETSTEPGYEYMSYRVIDHSRIVFSEGRFLLFRLHSSHEDALVGDVVVAMDSRGTPYFHYGHVCGGMVHFVSRQADLVVEEGTFFARFASDVSDLKWVKGR